MDKLACPLPVTAGAAAVAAAAYPVAFAAPPWLDPPPPDPSCLLVVASGVPPLPAGLDTLVVAADAGALAAAPMPAGLLAVPALPACCAALALLDGGPCDALLPRAADTPPSAVESRSILLSESACCGPKRLRTCGCDELAASMDWRVPRCAPES